jgi:hypothetical protein
MGEMQYNSQCNNAEKNELSLPEPDRMSRFPFCGKNEIMFEKALVTWNAVWYNIL